MCLGINAFALSGRVIANMTTPTPRVSLRLPWAMCSLGFQPDIDRQLYSKYNLTEDEISFIEKMIKPMD